MQTALCAMPAKSTSGSWEDYDRVAYHRYEVRLIAEESVILRPERLPNMLRGTFEMAFRCLVCHDVDLSCGECLLRPRCPYPPTFRPTPPAGAARLSKQSDLPRPFVFEPPLHTASEILPGQQLEFGLTLFGGTNAYLPYFVVALRELAAKGLGPKRGKLLLDSIDCLTPAGKEPVYARVDNTLRPLDCPFRLQDLVRQGDQDPSSVRIEFLSPTTLKRDGELVSRPSFSDVVRRLRDRLSTIAAFFGDAPLEIDFRQLGESADAIRTVEINTEWRRRTRRSSRTGDVHETSGFTGYAVYAGDLGPFMPLLRCGELMHVGKYSVWGNGRMRVSELGREVTHG